jgi:pimeloyl-ACP methyl ester carboxylesterase
MKRDLSSDQPEIRRRRVWYAHTTNTVADRTWQAQWDALRTYRVNLPQGNVFYRDAGTGEVLLFVHGLFVNGALWRKMVPSLATRFRCIAPDLPLGGHPEAMDKKADLSPPGLARLIASFMEHLDLSDVTIIANDTGGAFAQIVMANHPQRLSRLVLTNCDAYENFLPPLIRPLQVLGWIPGAAWLAAQVLRLRVVRWALFAPICREASDDCVRISYTKPLRNGAIRRDLKKVLRGIDNRHTLQAAKSFDRIDKPVLIAWGDKDLFFGKRYARRLAQSFPRARLETLRQSGALVPEDRPDELARLVMEFCNGRV